mmetsp:Transcript_26552/g.55707  ORF Transcript_26552/g.55707 Transcript_26552/m.55707 type:complete len:908 (+) Transcript_26552:135-2858(+)
MSNPTSAPTTFTTPLMTGSVTTLNFAAADPLEDNKFLENKLLPGQTFFPKATVAPEVTDTPTIIPTEELTIVTTEVPPVVDDDDDDDDDGTPGEDFVTDPPTLEKEFDDIVFGDDDTVVSGGKIDDDDQAVATPSPTQEDDDEFNNDDDDAYGTTNVGKPNNDAGDDDDYGIDDDVYQKQRVSSKADLVSFQSNWGPSHTGAMVYDFTRNSIYVTGSNYVDTNAGTDTWKRSSCFLGVIPMADISEWTVVQDPLPPQAKHRLPGNMPTPAPSTAAAAAAVATVPPVTAAPVPIDESTLEFTVPESLNEREQMACQAIVYDDSVQTDHFLFLGGVDEQDAKVRKGQINAFFNVYERTRINPEWQLDIDPIPMNPTLLYKPEETVPIRFPVAMVTGFKDGQEVLMTLMVNSMDPLLTEEYVEAKDANNPNNYKNNLLPPGLMPHQGYPKRGSDFFSSYQVHTYDKATKTFAYSFGEDLDGETTYPTGLVNLDPDAFTAVFVGYMKGKGPNVFANIPDPIFTDADPGAIGDPPKLRLDDTDGFVQYFRAQVPSFDEGIRFSSLEMNPPLNDYVHDVCLGDTNDQGVYDEFYVVGSTYGTMPPGTQQTATTTNILTGYKNKNSDGNHLPKLSSFVSKIVGGEVLWTTQFYAVDESNKRSYDALKNGRNEAFGCNVVQSEPDLMYVGGNVYRGSTMDSHHAAAGGDDVWVAQLNTDDGSIRWVQQLGSTGDDTISPTKGIQAAINGDCILYGETNGQLYRKKNNQENLRSDIFVTVLAKKDGTSAPTISGNNGIDYDRRKHNTGGSQKSGKKNGFIGAGSALVVIALLIGALVFYKFRRPTRRGQSRPQSDGKEGVFTDNIGYNDNNGSDELGIGSGGVDDAGGSLPGLSTSYSDNSNGDSNGNGKAEKSFV